MDWSKFEQASRERWTSRILIGICMKDGLVEDRSGFAEVEDGVVDGANDRSGLY